MDRPKGYSGAEKEIRLSGCFAPHGEGLIKYRRAAFGRPGTERSGGGRKSYGKLRENYEKNCIMDLFDFNDNEQTAKPLAERMRANSLNEFIGQKHIVSENSLLRRAIASDRLGSCIFWGPPGCGKTTLANIIALGTNGEFIKLNAVNSGVADVKKAVDQARDNLKLYGKRTYLMLDECHRFNKTQSDSLLPAIDIGTYLVQT